MPDPDPVPPGSREKAAHSRSRFTRRMFLRAAFYGVPAFCVADGFLVEPRHLVVHTVRLSDHPSLRVVQFSDLHYRGDSAYLAEIVRRINALNPDVVLHGRPDRGSRASSGGGRVALSRPECADGGAGASLRGAGEWDGYATTRAAVARFPETGGAWLINQAVPALDGHLAVVGITNSSRLPKTIPEAPVRILLSHYPADAAEIQEAAFDLLMAGHSHGGQVWIPLWGAVLTPDRVDRYQRGRYDVAAGPLYVNPGVGTWYLPVRFCCRPEITLFLL